MIRARKFLFLVALAGIATGGLATPTRADFVVSFSDGAGDSVTFDLTTLKVTANTGTNNAGALNSSITLAFGSTYSSGSVALTNNGSGGGYNQSWTVSGLDLGGTSNLTSLNITSNLNETNAPGLPSLATIAGSLAANNNLGVNLSNISLSIESSPFTAPTTPPGVMVTSSVSGTQYTGTVSGTYITQINNGNVMGTLVSLTGGTAGVLDSNVPTGYTLGGVVTLSMNSGSGISDASFSSTVVPTPAPSGMVLAAFGALCSLGGSYWQRRKAAVAFVS